MLFWNALKIMERKFHERLRLIVKNRKSRLLGTKTEQNFVKIMKKVSQFLALRLRVRNHKSRLLVEKTQEKVFIVSGSALTCKKSQISISCGKNQRKFCLRIK